MDASSQSLNEHVKYKLSLQDGTIKDCLYDGICADKHCFTTRRTKDEWVYHFLAKKDFKVNSSKIEVLTNQIETTSISKTLEPMEFMQIQDAWNRIYENKK